MTIIFYLLVFAVVIAYLVLAVLVMLCCCVLNGVSLLIADIIYYFLGPLSCTINDFWRMIWYHHCPIIVMITKLKERNEVTFCPCVCLFVCSVPPSLSYVYLSVCLCCLSVCLFCLCCLLGCLVVFLVCLSVPSFVCQTPVTGECLTTFFSTKFN